MKNKRILLIRYGLLAAAAVFTVIGLIKQEYVEVWEKAVKICLECIGIG